MKIKFDGTQIDGNAFAKITKSGKVYDGNFKLGSTICETYKINVNKDYINTIPSVVEIEGKNLCEIPDQTFTYRGISVIIKDGEITLNGTSTGSGTKYLPPIKTTIINGNYVNNIIYISGTRSGDSPNFNIRKASDNTLISGTQVNLNNNNNSKNFSIDTDTSIIFGFYISSNSVTFNNYKFKPQLVEGNDADYEYEPYTHKTLYVTDCNDNDDFVYTLDLEDAMTKFNFSYDASEIFVDDHTTLLAIFQDICQKAGVDTDINTFYGSEMQIGVYDNTYMARDYLGYIAEINGKNLRMNSSNNKLEFADINTTPVETINFEDISRFKIGVQHTISRVVLGDWQFGDDTGETYYINEDNPYAMNEEIVEHIYNEINGFTYYNFKTNDCPMTNLKLGDLVKFTYNENEYVTFVQYQDINFSGGKWFGGVEVNLESPVKQETQVIGERDRFRRIKRTVDLDHGRIDQVVEEQNEQSSQISTISQTVDTINQKISDIADVTVSGESSVAEVPLENINTSEPIVLKIYPIGDNISYLYPRNNLYPSNTLYSKIRTIRFVRTYIEQGETKTENIDYELPEDLLYYDSNNYDEFYLNYENQICQVTKKCKYNADGTIGLLPTPEIHDYTQPPYSYPIIPLEDGNYVIKILGYNSGYLYVQLMASNIYTTQFATRVEVTSQINQTASEINLEVAKKTNKDEIISTINQTPEQISINANKINLNGVVTANNNFKILSDGSMEAKNGKFEGQLNATTGNISGWNLTVDGFTNGTIFIRKNGYSNIYTAADIFILRAIILGEPWAEVQSGTAEFERYDLNNDGVINSQDYFLLRQLILGNI